MKKLKHIFFAAVAVVAISACTSDGENHQIRYASSDLSEMTVYVGSENGPKSLLIGGDTIQNMDSLTWAMANNYFGNLYTSDLNRFEGNQISFEFEGDRVTYVSRRDNNQILSTYEFRNDSLFIDMNTDGSKQLFAGLGSSPSDIHFVSGFAHFKGTFEGKDTTIIMMKSDTLLTHKMLAEEFGFADDLSDMTAQDTIVWCNVKYLFGK